MPCHVCGELVTRRGNLKSATCFGCKALRRKRAYAFLQEHKALSTGFRLEGTTGATLRLPITIFKMDENTQAADGAEVTVAADTETPAEAEAVVEEATEAEAA